jgi:hypothetical protein
VSSEALVAISTAKGRQQRRLHADSVWDEAAAINGCILNVRHSACSCEGAE